MLAVTATYEEAPTIPTKALHPRVIDGVSDYPAVGPKEFVLGGLSTAALEPMWSLFPLKLRNQRNRFKLDLFPLLPTSNLRGRGACTVHATR